MQFDITTKPARPIGLTPLIDVVFLLLMFFMLASTFTKHFDVALTSAGATTTEGEEKRTPLLIRLHADGRVDVNAIPVPANALGAHLIALKPELRLNAIVQVRAGANTQSVVDLLANLKGAGITNTILSR